MALSERGIKMFFVTHLYEFARGVYDRHDRGYLSLRAERRDDGARTFRLMPAEPEPTSYGQDSFRRIFGTPVGAGAGGR